MGMRHNVDWEEAEQKNKRYLSKESVPDILSWTGGLVKCWWVVLQSTTIPVDCFAKDFFQRFFFEACRRPRKRAKMSKWSK